MSESNSFNDSLEGEREKNGPTEYRTFPRHLQHHQFNNCHHGLRMSFCPIGHRIKDNEREEASGSSTIIIFFVIIIIIVIIISSIHDWNYELGQMDRLRSFSSIGLPPRVWESTPLRLITSKSPNMSMTGLDLEFQININVLCR